MNTPRTDPGTEVAHHLFENVPGEVRRLQRRHWAGIAVIAAAIVGTGLAVPALITVEPTAAPPIASAAASPAPVVTPSEPVAEPSPPPQNRAPAGLAAPRRSSAAPSSVERSAPAARRSRSASPQPARSAAAPETIVVQAENGSLSDGASPTRCEGCAGGARVRYLGRVEFDVTVATAGRRTITVAYTVDGTRRLTVAVNGTVVMERRQVSGTSWDTPRQARVEAQVPAGPVKIAVYGANEAPDVDAVTVSG